MQRKDLIIQEHLNGSDAFSIARKYGIDIDEVYKELDDFWDYLKALSKKGKYDEDLKNKLYDLLEKGYEPATIAMKINIPYSSVKEILRPTKYKYLSVESVKELSVKYNVSIEKIRRQLRKLCIKYEVIDEYKQDKNYQTKFVKEYLNGSSVADIANKYNVSREAVYLHLRKIPLWEGISKRKKLKRMDEKLQGEQAKFLQVYNLRKQGYSPQNISEKTKISYQRIIKLLKGSEYDPTYAFKRCRDKKIRELFSKGISRKDLEKDFKLSYQQICRIVRS